MWMKLLLAGLMLPGSYACQELSTEVKDDSSHTYFLNLYADGVRDGVRDNHVAVGATKKTTPRAACGTETRENSDSCNDLYEMTFEATVTQTSYPAQELEIDTANKDLAKIDDLVNYGISAPYRATVKFRFRQSDTEVYVCTLADATMGVVQRFAVAEICENRRKDVKLHTVEVAYTYHKDKSPEDAERLRCSIGTYDRYDLDTEVEMENANASSHSGNVSLTTPTNSSFNMRCDAERENGSHVRYTRIEEIAVDDTIYIIGADDSDSIYLSAEKNTDPPPASYLARFHFQIKQEPTQD